MRRLSGFSLMEMMTVLLIISIVAAASAPMINKRLMLSNQRNCEWTDFNGGISFNSDPNTIMPVVIGASTLPGGTDNAALYIEPRMTGTVVNPVIAFDAGNNNTFKIRAANEGIAINTAGNAPPTESVAIGVSASASRGDVAIGFNASSGDEDSVAIGCGSNSGLHGVVVGGSAKSAKDSTSIGWCAKAMGTNSIAIGSGANVNTGEADTVQLGNSDVKNLKVGNIDVVVDGALQPAPTPSDRRLKEVGKPFSAGLEELKKLEVFNFIYKKDKTKTPRVGVIAQDLQKIFPNAITKGADGFLRIRMEDMFYTAVNSIKELDNKTELQDKKLEELTRQNKELQKTIIELEKRLSKLEKKKIK